MGERLLDSTIATQTVLRFRTHAGRLQARLPAPWRIRPIDGGASAGANLAVIFNDVLLNQDAAGNPAPDAVSRYIGFAIPAQHPETEEEAGFNIRILTAHPHAVPGRYQTSRLGTITRDYYLKGSKTDATVTERFWFRDPGSGTVELHLQYRRGIPTRIRSEGHVRSAADPRILRIYRVLQLSDVVRSAPAGIDRVVSYQFRNTLEEFADLFDGREELISITIVPWYVRQVYGRDDTAP